MASMASPRTTVAMLIFARTLRIALRELRVGSFMPPVMFEIASIPEMDRMMATNEPQFFMIPPGSGTRTIWRGAGGEGADIRARRPTQVARQHTIATGPA